MIPVSVDDAGFTLPVRVTPRSGRNVVMAYKDIDERVQMKVAVPPEEGRANDRVVDMVSLCTGVPPSRVWLVQGHASRLKLLRLETDTPEAALEKLAAVLDSTPDRCFRVQRKP